MITIADVQDQIDTFFAPLFTRRLREVLLLGNLVNKDYEGSIAEQGDTVKVSQVNDPTGELRTVGTDADTFETDPLSVTKVQVTANKRAVCAYEFASLVELQSQINRQAVQDGMVFAVAKQINNFLFNLAVPSTSSPDHELVKSSIGLTELGEVRQLSAEAQWAMEGGWFGLLSPGYWNGILTNTTLASGDYVEDSPIIGGQKARRLMGNNLYEDNSRTGKYAIFFHPDFLLSVMQQAMQLKVSDLHAQKKFGFVMSADIVFGAALGIQGANKVIRVRDA